MMPMRVLEPTTCKKLEDNTVNMSTQDAFVYKQKMEETSNRITIISKIIVLANVFICLMIVLIVALYPGSISGELLKIWFLSIGVLASMVITIAMILARSDSTILLVLSPLLAGVSGCALGIAIFMLENIIKHH